MIVTLGVYHQGYDMFSEYLQTYIRYHRHSWELEGVKLTLCSGSLAPSKSKGGGRIIVLQNTQHKE